MHHSKNERLTIKRSHVLKGTDIQIGGLAYGCWRLAGTDVKEADTKIRTALDCGMNLIDTADIYGSRWPDGFGEAEALLGDVLMATPALRHQMVLATKGGIVPGLPYRSTGDYLLRACEASLKRLKTDVIDLYQVHRPDLLAHPQEVAHALNKLVASGKVRTVGVSNYTPAQTAALQAYLDFPLVSQQPEFSALHTGPMFDGTFDQCMETGMLAFAWSPLAGGDLLTDTPKTGSRAAATILVLDRLATDHGTSRSAIGLVFLMAHPAGVIPIIGTQTPARIREATEAFDVPLSRRDWYDILETSLGHAMP